MNPKQSVNASEMACEKTTKTVEVFLRGGDSWSTTLERKPAKPKINNLNLVECMHIFTCLLIVAL